MIFITGDCHGSYGRFATKKFPISKKLTKNDFVIICGDFGFWDESDEQKYKINWLNEKPFTTLWVDGNHENFDLLKEYPLDEWNGGRVQFIDSSVIHLLRGEIFSLEKKKFFTFGGARSHDISDGILEPDTVDFSTKQKKLIRKNASFRINHQSWWKEEMPAQEEFVRGLKQLTENNNEVDYIISHCAPSNIQNSLDVNIYQADKLTDYFQKLSETVSFKKWFFGHYHDNRQFGKFHMLYDDIVEI